MAFIDGRSKHPLYKKWKAMRARCAHDPSYTNISVCDRWDNFWNFLDDMGMPPTTKHQLDRINPRLSYGPSNCRWVTSDTQAFNKGIYKNNTSGIKGIFKKGEYWYARISSKGNKIIVGSFIDKSHAISVRDHLVEAHGNIRELIKIKEKFTIKRHRFVNRKR